MTRKSFIGMICMLSMIWVSAASGQGLPDFTDLVEETAPAVVNIQVTQYGNRARNNEDSDRRRQDDEEIPEFFRRFFDVPNGRDFGQPDRYGAGSGFIIESEGYIVTNHHVIEDADQIIVRLADRREFEAELVGSDEQSDIALLKIDSINLPSLKLGESDTLRPGEWVLAIGSPFNLEQSVTAGIVSAKGRPNGNQRYVPFIQTDVAINRGNSGGPLLNMNGEVVGINSWILSSTGGSIGISFSIPIEVANRTVEQLREFGKVSRGLLGVTVGAVTRELAEAMQLDRPVGALVNEVSRDSAAEKAGIQPGDIILEFDGAEIETSNDLPPLVGANPPGTKARVLVSRDGEERRFDVVLDALEPADDDSSVGPSSEDPRSSNVLGLSVRSITNSDSNSADYPEDGVVIEDVESDEAWRAGLRPGDVILMINRQAISGISDFNQVAEGIPSGRAVALRIWRNGVRSFVAYTPESED